MAERLTPREITPMTQSLEASCVATSISMVFSGFGVDISEQVLVDRYFQTAKLPKTDPALGVSNTSTIKGFVQIIKDLDLRGQLQIDVFAPRLHEYTRSPEDRYIVEAQPSALRRYGKKFEKGDEIRGFYETLEQLLKEDEIGVYTANAKMLGLPRHWFTEIPDESRRGFYSELVEWIRKGHIVGPHGGMTMHMRALDGSRMEKIPRLPNEEGFLILDPRGENYTISPHSLVWVDSLGVYGDLFDFLFRVSPREESLRSQNYGFRRFIQNLRNLIP